MTGIRNLTTPVKVVGIVIAVLFATVGFLARDTYFRITGSTSDAQAAIFRLQQDKLDKSVFEKQCDVTRYELSQKADRDKVEVVQKRLDQILGIMLDPGKKEAVRAQIQAEKANR